MANNIIKRVWNQNKMVNIEGLSGAAFQAESGGHTFQISGIDDTGATVALSGTVTGVFRRPDNADIALTGASTGGVASVTLTDDCYAVPGRFGLTVFVTSGGQKTAVYAAIGTVASTNGGAVAGDTPQDVVDLINAIAAAVATIPADYTDLMAAIAPMYSNSALYAVGSYAWYDGDLYRCTTPITTAETWTAAHWTVAAIGNDVSDLKSSLDYDEGVLDAISDPVTEEASGTKTTGKFINYNAVVVDAVSSYYINTYNISSGDKFIINGAAGSGGYCFIFTDANNNTIGKSEKNTTSGILSYQNVIAIAPENATKLIVSSHSHVSYQQAIVYKITGYAVNGISELDNRIDAVEDILVDVTETASASSSDWTEHDGEYMFTSGSTTTGTGWRYIEYPIPSNATALIVKAKAGQSARLWILKDANNTVLGYSDDSSSASVKTETVNLSNYTGATKLFVNDKDSDDLSIQYQYTAKKVSGDDIEWDGATIDEVLASNPLWGKILCCAGDSITYGADMDAEGITNTSNITVYQSDASGNFTQTQTGFLKTWNWQIASRNKMTLYNAGVSGSTMQGQGGVNGFSLADGRYTKLPDSIDYLLIWFGWNDNAYGTLGTINDNTNASYYGGYNVVLPYLINKYPYAKIGLIVPFGSSAGHREAVRLLGNKWGCAVWDNYQGGTPLYFGKEDSVGVEASIVTANRAKFQANGAHPNFKGHRQLADMIEEWLKGI